MEFHIETHGINQIFSVPTEKERTVTGMTEYIEREAAKARLRIWITDCVLYGDNDEADCFRSCIDLIDSIPAADVAPVVRCKEIGRASCRERV